jgi:hypothetical protein
VTLASGLFPQGSQGEGQRNRGWEAEKEGEAALSSCQGPAVPTPGLGQKVKKGPGAGMRPCTG